MLSTCHDITSKPTQFCKALNDEMLGFNNVVLNQDLITSLTSKRVSYSKYIFKRTLEKYFRNQKLRKRCKRFY